MIKGLNRDEVKRCFGENYNPDQLLECYEKKAMYIDDLIGHFDVIDDQLIAIYRKENGLLYFRVNESEFLYEDLSFNCRRRLKKIILDVSLEGNLIYRIYSVLNFGFINAVKSWLAMDPYEEIKDYDICLWIFDIFDAKKGEWIYKEAGV